MPIKGLTDRGLRFPEIGQIRKGAKKDPNAPNKPGKDLTYFRVEFDEREKEAAQTFFAAYGPQPTEIHIFLPFDSIPQMWDAWLEAYTAGRLVARSDGEYFTYLVDTKTGNILVKNGIEIKTGLPKPYLEGQVVGYYISQAERNKGKEIPIYCKPTGRLKVVIPELVRSAYLTLMTTSYHDIQNISSQLEAFSAVNQGRLAGIPLVLRRRPKMISTPNPDGSRARREKWMLSIEADPVWVRSMLGELQRLSLPAETQISLSPSTAPIIEEEVSKKEFEEEEEEEGIEDGRFTEIPPRVEAGVTAIPPQPDPPDDWLFNPAPVEAQAASPAPVTGTKDLPTEKGWEEWNRLAERAKKVGVVLPVIKDDITKDELKAAYMALLQQVSPIEAKNKTG